jgi:membrane fusion protein, multidrug efflux system
MSARLLRSSRATGRETEGIEIRESEVVRAPVTLGIVRPAIVLPADWREWDGPRLEAVLAHERSHIRRRDPALQALSAMHRAVLWHSPLSWWLHSRIVRTAEEASDDAAVVATRDRAFYAEVLLGFVQAPGELGIPMARYDRPDQRIHRILDGAGLPRGLTRGSLAAILLLGLPLAYLVAAAGPQSAPDAASQQAKPVKTAAPKPAADDRQTVAPTTPAQADAASDVLTGLGNVVASNTVTVKSRVDGELLSVSFKEGDLVQQGQLLATIDARPYEVQVEQAEAQVAQDQAALNNAQQELERYQRLVAQNMAPAPEMDSKSAEVAQLKGRLKGDEAALQGAKLQVSYAHIVAPISGVVGLRQIDPGNIVHASDKTGILVITQLQPIAVVFEVPEDDLPQIRARLAQGAGLPAEAWNRDQTTKIATGRVTAVDNQIDLTTGAVKLKAEFDNKDGALYPNQFVNVRLHLNSR